MPRGHLARGAAAEAFAARALEREGWRIVLRNHRTPAGEIDLVALRAGVLAFVEVKARVVGGSAGGPGEALGPAKLRRVARAGEALARERGLQGARRVLLGALVDLAEDGTPATVRIVPVEDVR